MLFNFRTLLSLIGFAILLGTLYDVCLHQTALKKAKSGVITVVGEHLDIVSYVNTVHITILEGEGIPKGGGGYTRQRGWVFIPTFPP